MAVYRGGSRLFNQESFGYSTLSLGTPGNPAALRYEDLRFSGVTAAGDGQSYTFGSAVSDDGSMVAIGLGGPGDGWGVIAGTGDGAEGFRFTGSFGFDRATVALVHTVSRYIVYGFATGGVTATDITALPTTLAKHNMDAYTETTAWSGYLPKSAGGWLLFLTGSGIQIVDSSAPGAVGHISSGMPSTTLTAADFGGRGIQYYTAAENGAGLYVLVELRPLAGENSYTYALVSVAKNLTKVVNGYWRVPSAAGESWTPAGISASISNGRAFLPAMRMTPSLLVKGWTAPIVGWPGVPVAVDVTGVNSFGMAPASLGGYVYLPTGSGGFVLPGGAK